jgi:hypothetical protein
MIMILDSRPARLLVFMYSRPVINDLMFIVFGNIGVSLVMSADLYAMFD